jgi:hypothetical protein
MSPHFLRVQQHFAGGLRKEICFLKNYIVGYRRNYRSWITPLAVVLIGTYKMPADRNQTKPKIFKMGHGSCSTEFVHSLSSCNFPLTSAGILTTRR